jgi:endosialidase-like protein
MKTIVLSGRSPIGRPTLRQGFFLIPLVLSCFALLPGAQAVNPPPDGGYPGGNTAEGTQALQNLTTGVWNTALGFQALNHDTEGFNNTATGLRALFSNTTGSINTAIGVNALYSNTTGTNNTATGFGALFRNTTGIGNTANGDDALLRNTTGSSNTANGDGALFTSSTGNSNTATGTAALANNTTGNRNTALGVNAGNNVTTADNVIAIGANVPGENVSNTCYIGNIFGVTSPGATAVYVNSLGKIGTVVSSQRFKEEIRPMDKASDAILALKPVTFRYKHELDPAGILQFGLVAEEVEKVNPDLVVRDAEGKVNTVRYEAVNAMLLNEFLKEHRKVEEQDVAIARLKQDFGTKIAQQAKQIEALAATVNEQAAQIQKVSAQIEVGKPVPRTVLNNW